MSLNLHLREQGESGPVVLLLHGLFGSATNWGSIGRGLAGHYRVLTPDLRNHGQSPHHPDMSYAAMGEDILALLDRRGIDRCVLVGHSMGGKVAMQLALTHPQRVAGIAVVDMAPVAYRHRFDRIFRGFDAVDLANLVSRSEADEQMARNVIEPDVRAFLLQNLRKTNQGWRWRLNLDALRGAQREITGFAPPNRPYRGPSWFIHGTNSDYLLPEYEPEIFRHFPRAQVCPVAGAGHWVYAEKPQGFSACLKRFLGAL